MPENAVDQILASAMFAPFLSFVGVAIMVLWQRGIEKSRLAIAVIGAPIFTILAIRIGLAWVRSTKNATWLPADGSVEALIGLIVGLSVLNIIAILFRLGRQAETEAINRIGGN